MSFFDNSALKSLYKPSSGSHKGENGRVLIIAGSELFHGAALWPAEIASRIVDLVFFSSTPFNNKIFEESREVFRNGIVVPRGELDGYIDEADVVLIGPGMVRAKDAVESSKYKVSSIEDIEEIIKLEDEGAQTYYLTKYLLEKYPRKKFVIDGGALQMMENEWLSNLSTTPIITPHQGEFTRLKDKINNAEFKDEIQKVGVSAQAQLFARRYNCVVLLKGQEDTVCDGEHCVAVPGGNPGMTKGGTGDVLAGIVASLYAKNPPFLSAAAASYINKRAGDSLTDMVGPYFNASDLAQEVPVVMNEIMTEKM